MKPILFTIPSLPSAYLPVVWALLGITAAAWLLLGARYAKRSERGFDAATPLVLAGMAGFGAWLSTRYAVPVHSYGLFLIIGFFTSVAISLPEARRRGLDPNIVLDLALPLLVTAVILCRLLFVILNPGQFHSLLQIVRIWDGGLSFHGALVASFLVCIYFAKVKRVSMLRLADVLAPSVFLGYAIGRLGCLFNGCCYGDICSPNLLWAMRFPDEHNVGHLTPLSHPAQLYSSVLALLCFALMQKAKRAPAFNKFPGQLMLIFFGLYAVERAIVEYFRNGATSEPILGTTWLTDAQLASAIGLVAIAITWGILARRANHNSPPAMPNPQSNVPAR